MKSVCVFATLLIILELTMFTLDVVDVVGRGKVSRYFRSPANRFLKLIQQSTLG